ncbi:hypothetical protein SAMD00019534_035730 [Acytostelium subglobosum LB1]|uniref:hypothetical protein n=1 Tax=Acytostelium subglobosum LB1 TaxID=1410327 RepID=UPI000644D21E|nr:hypothetical protein SAMD00019534_035730 [Acytostelium subglobosum LB1]GAM20398.1 hypothetical protein SAMD00019534_035730 [Acytostelium subglobosum LB1]|eukprot:XP_012759919.1 hypothetical protein SAMD00019534_035730 [Acytostelium subglobosum LB1]
MQVLQTKVEGKGNGIKTVVLNLPAVARDLDRAPEYITKFFEIELGSQTNIESGKYSVNGDHTTETLARVLDTFITRYVLCGHCKNPETKFIIKTKNMDLKCAACGNKTALDLKSKMSGFIQKNPPKASKSSRSKTTADEATSKPSSKDFKKQKEEEEDDEEWSVDVSEKSVEERKLKAIGQSTAVVMAMMDIGDVDETDPVAYMTAMLVSEQEFINNLDTIKEKFSLPRSYDVSRIAIEAIGNKSAANIINAIKNRKALLRTIVKKKDGQYGAILGIEQMCGKDETLLKSLVSLFKILYDDDIISEEAFLKWDDKTKVKDVKKAAAPFIQWLRTADEEEEEEDEEEEEEEEEEEAEEEEGEGEEEEEEEDE